MKLRLNHVSLRVTDLDRARAFYTGILGLAPHPQKTNWLGAGQGCLIHLMTPTLDDAGGAPAPDDTPAPARTDPARTDPARHVALEVASLEEAVAALLKGGARPYQATVDQKSFRAIATADQPLDFGIGTVFVRDPDDNVIEFVQRGRGILGEYDPG